MRLCHKLSESYVTVLTEIYGNPNFFLDPVRVLSIGRNPIQVLLIRSDPVRVLSIRSDPVRLLSTPFSVPLFAHG